MKKFIVGLVILVALFAFVANASGNDSSLILDSDNLYPLQTLTITVVNVSDFCTINVFTPDKNLHSFNGTITGDNCTVTYIPSYIIGTYKINATTNGSVTETDEFIVDSSNWNDSYQKPM